MESRAGASSTESILQLELYVGLEADSTCSGSVWVYNSKHTIAERARLCGVHSGLYECVLILLTDRNLTGGEMYWRVGCRKPSGSYCQAVLPIVLKSKPGATTSTFVLRKLWSVFCLHDKTLIVSLTFTFLRLVLLSRCCFAYNRRKHRGVEMFNFYIISQFSLVYFEIFFWKGFLDLLHFWWPPGLKLSGLAAKMSPWGWECCAVERVRVKCWCQTGRQVTSYWSKRCQDFITCFRS